MEQGLRQGRMPAPLLFNSFCAAVINVASTLQGGQRHHGRFGTPEEEKGGGGAGGRGEATAGESVLATPLWGMLYADETGVVSRSPEKLRKMMGGGG